VDEIFGRARHPYTRGLLAAVPRIDERHQGRLPTIGGQVPTPGDFTAEDKAILDAAGIALLDKVRQHMDRQEIHLALEAIWRVVGDANSYFAAAAPWALKKTDPKRMETVLYVTAEVLRNVGLLIQPVMPQSAAKLLDQLAVPEDARAFSRVGEAGRLAAGAALPAPQGIFPRIVTDEAAARQA